MWVLSEQDFRFPSSNCNCFEKWCPDGQQTLEPEIGQNPWQALTNLLFLPWTPTAATTHYALYLVYHAIPCEAVPRDTVPRPAQCFSTTPGVAMPHSAEHTMVGRGVVFVPGIPPPLVPLLSQVGYYESKIIVCIQMYVYKYRGHLLLEVNHLIDLNHITFCYDHHIKIPYHSICINRLIQGNFRMLPIDK